MKTHKTLILVAGLVLAIQPNLQAQQRGPGERPQGPGQGGPGGRGPGMMLPVMTALDKDKDGELSAEELKNAPQSLATLDKNEDGKLDADELMPEAGLGRPERAETTEPDVSPDRPQGRPQIEGRPQVRNPEFLWRMPVMAALDTDEDRAVSADEIKNAPAALGKLDVNEDGKLDRMELRPNFRGEGGPRGQGPGARGNPEAAVNRLMERDANNDGFLTADELPGRMAALLERGDENKDGKLSRTELTAVLGSTDGRGGFQRGGQGGGPRADGPRER